MKRRAIAVMPILIWAVAGFGHAAPPPSNNPPLLCVPTLVASPAGCTFNIYGTVTDVNGAPVAGVYVSDGSQSEITDAQGFYDLHQLQPGDRTLTYSYGGCGLSKTVSNPADSALLEGGTRQDVQLPCTRREGGR